VTCPYCGTRDKRPGRDSCGPCEQPVKTRARRPRKAAVLRDRERWPRRERFVIQRRHQTTGQVETLVQWRSTIKARSAPFAGRTHY
jgi:hypothetical protein